MVGFYLKGGIYGLKRKQRPVTKERHNPMKVKRKGAKNEICDLMGNG
jgi:hypothetical protein